MEQSPRIVECLGNVSAAFCAYDRALFYYDPAIKRKPEHKNFRINTKQRYCDVLAKLPVEGCPSLVKKEAAILDWLGARTAKVYWHTVKILTVSHSSTVSLYLRLIDKLGKDVDRYVDRNPSKATSITEEHLERATVLIEAVLARLNKNKENGTWCSYRVEFGLLKEMCSLVFSEIDFLKARIGEMEQELHQRINEAHQRVNEEHQKANAEHQKNNEAHQRRSEMWARRGLAAALVAILVSIWTSQSEDAIEKNNIPIILNGIREDLVLIGEQSAEAVALMERGALIQGEKVPTSGEISSDQQENDIIPTQ